MIRYYLKTIQTNLNQALMFQFSKRKADKYEDTIDDQFKNFKEQYTDHYFQEYRKQVQKDTVLKDFRKKVFQKEALPDGVEEYEKVLNQQQNHIDKMLKKGTDQEVVQYSKKLMQNFAQKRKVFKGNSTKDVFKNYADYSMYKSNYAKLDDRNYEHLDRLDRDKVASSAYEFIDNLPDDYSQKQRATMQMRQLFPSQFRDMSISDYGKFIQQNFDLANKVNESAIYNAEMSNKHKKSEQQSPHDDNQNQRAFEPFSYVQFQSAGLSPQSVNKIYELYLQGWNIRDISRRFGIIPRRAKFHIWARARLFNEALPKFGPRFVADGLKRQNEKANQLGSVDYGLDIPYLNSERQYQQITKWNQDYIDAQRKPEEYTSCLEKLQKKDKISRSEFVEVGTVGEGSKRYSLQEWNVFRGKGSDRYFLKNGYLKPLYDRKRKYNKTYS